MVMSLSSFLPFQQLSEEGRLYLCSDWVYWYTIQSVINNFTIVKGIFNVCFFIWTNMCPSLQGIALCSWICVWNTLLDWGTLQIIVYVGYRDEVVIINHVKHYYRTQSEVMQLIMFLSTFLLLILFRLAITKGLNYYWLKTVQLIYFFLHL